MRFAKKYINWWTYVKAIASRTWDIFRYSVVNKDVDCY